jgi:hypothetical protein
MEFFGDPPPQMTSPLLPPFLFASNLLLKLRIANDGPEKIVSAQQDAIVRENVVDADDTLLAELPSSRNGDPRCSERPIEKCVS